MNKKWFIGGLAAGLIFTAGATLYGNYGGGFSLYDPASGNTAAVSSGGALSVSGSFTPSGTQNVAITSPLGQALSAASVPVVLPAAQITTLTPPAAITNYAQETGGNLATVVTNTGAAEGSVAPGTAATKSQLAGGVYTSGGVTLTTGQQAALQLDSAGNQFTVARTSAGAAADGFASTATFSSSANGNVISQFTLPFLFNGSSWDRSRSGGVTGMAGVSLQASPSGAYTYNHIAAATTTTVKSGSGTLHSVTINSLGTVASTLTIYDNTAGSGTVIGIINSLSITGTLTFDVAFATGLTIVSTGTVAPDVTVSYK